MKNSKEQTAVEDEKRMNGLPYYKAYPRDFIEGTVGMPFELKGAYRLVLDLIYLQGGRLPDDPRYISGLLGCSVRKWTSLRNRLVGMGKIQVSGCCLTNYRAIIELETSRKLQDKQRENASGPRKNNDLEKPRNSHTEPESYSTTSTKVDVDGDAVIDFTKAIFENGVAYLGRHGTPEARARSLIGKWRRDHADREIFDALAAANRQGCIDPVSYISGILSKRDEGERLKGIMADALREIREENARRNAK